eukprot:1363251-Rhodomonas_salina.1
MREREGGGALTLESKRGRVSARKAKDGTLCIVRGGDSHHYRGCLRDTKHIIGEDYAGSGATAITTSIRGVAWILLSESSHKLQ